MQVYPALPWQGAINGGEIKLLTPVEFPELSNRLSVVLSYHGQGEEFEEAIFTTEGADIILARDDSGLTVRMYNVTISDDGKTIVLTNPTSDASSYPIWDIQERTLRLYPSFPLSAGSNALLILPHSMTSEDLQEGLFPIYKNGHDEEVVGKVEVYPSDNKLYLSTDQELWLLCANVDNQVPSARYYSLQLQPYTYQSEQLSFENIITTPSTPLMVPSSPWGTSVQIGKIILPSPVTRQDILDGALVFSTDYDIDGVHYDHFKIASYAKLTLQLGEGGEYRVFEIGDFSGSTSVLSISRYDASSVAPLTGVKRLDFVFISPSLPWSATTNSGLIRCPYKVNPDTVGDDLIFISSMAASEASFRPFEVEYTYDEDGWVDKVYLSMDDTRIYDLSFDYRDENTLITASLIEQSGVYLREVEEIPTLPVQGDVQVFSSNRCTKIATGNVGIVYARINKPWSEPWSVGDSQSSSFQALSADYGLDCALYYRWLSSRSWPNYKAGDVIEFGGERLDITNFQKVFTKPS